MPESYPSVTALTRRTGLGVGLLGLALAAVGCDAEDLTGRRTPGAGARGSADPDEQIVQDVRGDVTARLAAVVATLQAHPRLRALAPLEAMHRTHLAALTPQDEPSDSPTASPSAVVVPPGAGRASRRLLADEAAHRHRLAAAAGTARSGALARLVGSMSAGVAAHLATADAPDAGAVAPTPTDLDALQVTLAAEHAAVYVYGVLGARTSESVQPTLLALLQAAYVAHRDLRDLVVGTVAATGATPVGAAAAYVVPAGPGLGVDTPAQVAATAAVVETGCAATYASQVGTAAATTRAQAVGWLQEAAVRLVGLGQPPADLPGIDA